MEFILVSIYLYEVKQLYVTKASKNFHKKLKLRESTNMNNCFV